jgi:predicted nucleic acid-binding protein
MRPNAEGNGLTVVVVSDTSPLMNLAVVGRLGLIEQLYGSVHVPEAVAGELAAALPEQFSSQAIKNLTWLTVCSVRNRQMTESLLLDLDAGEAEAIVLSTEMKADRLTDGTKLK